MGSLLVVTGPPGAGKSTVARIIAARRERGVLVEGDAFFGFLAGGAIEPWLVESNEQNAVVTRAAASATGHFTFGGYDAVYDGVVGPWFLPTFFEAARLEQLDYVILLPSLDQCIERVATRQGHGFNDETATRQLHGDFARSGIDRRHIVDISDDPDSIASTIEEAARNGQLTYRA